MRTIGKYDFREGDCFSVVKFDSSGLIEAEMLPGRGGTLKKCAKLHLFCEVDFVNCSFSIVQFWA